jgi:COP9 signalosome complex subunit 1
VDRSTIKRLIFIANSCPQLTAQALGIALQYAHQGRDTQLYQNILTAYNGAVGPRQAINPDREWLEKTFAKNQTDKDKLEVELKMYTGNMIKESVRVRGYVVR